MTHISPSENAAAPIAGMGEFADRRGAASAAFQAIQGEIEAALRARWSLRFIYERFQGRLPMSYAHFTRCVHRYIRRTSAQDGTQTPNAPLTAVPAPTFRSIAGTARRSAPEQTVRPPRTPSKPAQPPTATSSTFHWNPVPDRDKLI